MARGPPRRLLSRPFAQVALGPAFAEGSANTARALVAVLILQRLAGRRAAMDRLEQVGAVFVAVAVGEALSATVAMLARRAGEIIEVSEMGVFWRSWWLGGLAGGLVVVPLALAWAHTRASAWRGRRAVEGALVLAAVAGLSALALSADQPLTYIVFPAFIWAALRLGPQGATLAVAVAAVIAVLATSNAVGTLRRALAHRQRPESPALHHLRGADDVAAWRRSSASAATRRWSWPSRSAARVSAPPRSDSASPATCTTRSHSRCSPPPCTSGPRNTRWSSRSSTPTDPWGRS